MKHLNQSFLKSLIGYVVNLIITIFLSFSFVYALTTTWKMTYGAKDVLIQVFYVLLLCSIAFANRISFIISVGASILAAIAGLVYLYKNPDVFNLVYTEITSTYLWLKAYINNEAPLNIEYQNYVLLALSMVISLVVYIFTVKRFNFYVLLIAGASLFVAQWILEYFIIYLSFYIFLFFILLCYFKHVYLNNTATNQSTSVSASSGFLLYSAPICALVFLFAYYMPASDKPLAYTTFKSNSGYFTINSTGFSEESSRLGGNVSLDDTLVMKVDSPKGGIYLKGAVRDVYTGYSWESTQPNLKPLGERFELHDFNTDLLDLTEVEVFNKTSINITYENLMTKTLFIPAKTERLKFHQGPFNVLLNDYGLPSSENFLGRQFQYTVELYSMKNTKRVAQLLRKSSSGMYDRRYLQLPAEVPARVGQLAIEITSSAKNDYDRTKAIETYLSTNYVYTLEPGKVPNDRDLVDYFLFDHKQGYCTYYASAMTVLVRSIGIPARYVEGYVLPSKPAHTTTYEVTNRQAHAWVEVYFEGFGWIPFEPTSPSFQNFWGTPETSETSALTATPEAVETSEQTTNVESTTPDQQNNEQRNPTDGVSPSQDSFEVSSVGTDRVASKDEQPLSFRKIAGTVLLSSLLWAALFSPLRRKFRLQMAQKLNPRQSVIQMYKHYLKALSLQGIPIKPGETPLQYAQRVDESLDFKPISFKTVTDAFIKARYSNVFIHNKERQLLIDFQSTFAVQSRVRTGWVRYFIYNNLLGLI